MIEKKYLTPDPTNSALVIIDIQQKLAAAMPPKTMEILKRNTLVLLAMAQEFQIPVLITEQYPAGLGPTLPEIQEKTPQVSPISKMSFSCLEEPAFADALRQTGASQVILCGIECHVCVLQTALALVEAGKNVFVVKDAVCSRRPNNNKTGLALMQEGGAVLTTTEIVLFQLLRQAGTDRFKKLSRLIR